MIYEVAGGNKKQRDVVDKAMSYVIHLLNIPSHVIVEVQLGVFQSHGVMQESKRRFYMEIMKNVTPQEIAYTVFHEMKHVEQLSRGKLVYTNQQCLWEGEDHSNTEYFDRPWEVEAYRFEKSADLMLSRI
jgi:hypothetical protein